MLKLFEWGDKTSIYSEVFGRSIFRDSPVATLICDSNQKVLDVNQSCLELFGVSKKVDMEKFKLTEAQTISKSTIVKLKHRETICYEKEMDFDSIKSNNLVATSRTGKVYTEVSITPLFHEDTEIINNFLIHIQDITNRKKIEQRLKTSEERFKHLYKNIGQIHEENEENFYTDGIIFDLSEHKISKGKLKASENLLRNIFENASHGIALIKPDGKFLIFNERAASMLGYSMDEFVNMTLLSITHPDDLEKSQERLKMLLDGDISSYRIEKRYLTRNKEEFWVDLSVSALYGDTGSITTILGILVDINERKKAEIKFKKSEDIYRNLVSNIKDIIVEIDLKGTFLYASPQVYGILGYNPEEVMGINGFNLVHPDDKERVKFILRKAVKSKNYIYLEFRTLHKNGNYIDMSAYGKVACVDGVDRVFLVIRDISARKLAEKSARESQQLLEHTFNALNDAIFVLNNENPPNILRCNLTAERIFGYSIKEMVKRPISFLHINRKSLEKFQQILYPIIEQGKVLTDFKYQMKRKDGSVFPSKHCVIPLKNYSGTRIGWVSIVRDITKQVEAEQKIKESEEKYRRIFDNSPLGIGIATMNGKVIAINKKMEELTGYSVDELNNLGLENDYIDPHVRTELLGKIKEQGFVRNYEVKKKHKDGAIYIASINVDLIDIEEEPLLHTTIKDITYQKLAEERLKETEQKFRSFVESTPVATFLYQNYDCIYANPAALNLTEYSIDELRTLKFWDFVHPDYRQSIINIGKLIENNEPFSLINEVKIITKLGTEKWINGSMVLIEHEGKRAALISAFDVTKKKETEQSLKQSEERYKNFIQNFQGIAFRGYIDFSIGFLHGAVEEITGYQLSDFLSQKIKWNQIIHSEDIQRVNESVKAFHSSDRLTDSREYRIIRKDGKIRWVLEKLQKIHDPIKKKEGVQGLIVDINERKEIEHKLKDSEEKFRTIAEQSLLGLSIVQDDSIVFLNNAFANILEYPIEEIQKWSNKDTLSIIYEEDLPKVLEQLDLRKNGNFESIINYKCRIRTKKGNLKWVEAISKPIEFKGRIASIFSLIDISASKKAEEELIEVNKLKSEFVSRTSHELKTPLVSIQGYIDLLLEIQYKKFDSQTISILHEIKYGCNRLRSLISDLLETSKFEQEEIQLNKGLEDLSFLIRYCLNELRGILRQRNHIVNLEIHDTLITKFEKEKIYDVIINLLSNAINYTSPNGIITIKSKILDGFYVVSVEDNGIGLTEIEKSKIFKKFGKIERYGQGFDIISEGSGLGLYISKKIVELHGGSIWAESKGRNKGSKFSFSLPIDK